MDGTGSAGSWLWGVGSNLIARSRKHTSLRLSGSILTNGSRSNGCGRLDLKWAELRWLAAAERSVDDGGDATGGEGEGGVAHRAQGVTAMLGEVLVGRGALGVCGNSSPEWRTASGASGGRRGRRYGSPQDKVKTWLDAQDRYRVVCEN